MVHSRLTWNLHQGRTTAGLPPLGCTNSPNRITDAQVESTHNTPFLSLLLSVFAFSSSMADAVLVNPPEQYRDKMAFLPSSIMNSFHETLGDSRAFRGLVTAALSRLLS